MSTTNNLITWPRVVLYGDSITQYSFSSDGCWGTFLADKLQRKCDVINRGFSGYNSCWNLLMLPRIINKSSAQEVVAFTIFLGANDSTMQDVNPKQHVPVDEYKSNISKMVDYLSTIGIDRSRIIVIGPPPCDEDAWRARCEAEGKTFSKCNKLAGKYSRYCSEAASESSVEFLELYNSMMAEQNWKSFLNDGLHFSARGSQFLFDKLWPCIERRTAHLPAMIQPYWGNVDHNNPEKDLLV